MVIDSTASHVALPHPVRIEVRRSITKESSLSQLTQDVASAVARVPAADTAEAIAHFSGRLAFETDVSDVHSDLELGIPNLVIVDSRGDDAWQQGHVRGAVHLPTGDIASRAGEIIPAPSLVVTYCWGPGCNGATRAALEFAKLGYPVKEMLGGYEYWVREGLPVQVGDDTERRAADPLTAPSSGITCDC